VPVPEPLASCQDAEVIGAPFYLMRYVEGLVLRTMQDGELLSLAQGAELSDLLAQMMAMIHGVDLAATGLDTFGRPEGYLARQLSRWQRQWEMSNTREMPGYAELVARLTAGLPDPAKAEGTLVHGDFRLDNTLVQLTTPARIAAVVDWEMSTLGDPLADLGLTLSYWADGGDAFPDLNVGATVTALPGFYNRGQFGARYAELTGRDIGSIGYYIAFGYFKLAVVLEGIHARYLLHQTVGEGFEREGPAVPILIARAHQMLDTVA
jgi:aminoglycoside phosphotransferase (APT) family kinase protein